jgi:hypothetical protein
MNRWLRLGVAVVILMLTSSAERGAFGQQPQPPLIISGNDVGFRVDLQRTDAQGRLTGTWVVRFNGQWVEPDAAMRTLPLNTR